MSGNSFGDNIQYVTFDYNGNTYGGIEFFFTNANHSQVYFIGESNFDIFGLDYYNTNTSTVLNSEVNNSISTTNMVAETDFFFNNQKIFHAGNDGSTSGLDAQYLQGIPVGSFVRSDASDTMSGNYRIESGSFASLILDRGTTGSGSIVQFENNNGLIGGIGAYGDDGLQFRTADGTQMILDSNNKVSIGTTTPLTTGGAHLLTIATPGTQGLTLGASGTDLSYIRRLEAEKYQWQAYGSGGNGGQIHLQPYGGSVGIGTTNPSEKLEVVGKVRASDNFEKKGSGGYYLYNSSMGFRGALYDNGSVTSIYGDGNGSTPVININSDNVGIGTTSPSSPLTVAGTIESLPVSTTEGGDLRLRAATGKSYRYTIDNYSDNLRFIRQDESSGGNGQVRMFINSSGDVGIGTSSPAYKVDVDGDVNITGNFKVNGTNISTGGSGYTHPTHPGDDISIDTGALTGATVISDLDFNVTSDTEGHITDANATVSTRNLTASDIGAAAASHTHGSYDNSGTLTGANVYSQVAVTDGIVTGLTSRTLTASDIGAAASSHSHGNLTSTGGWSSSPATIGSGDYVIIGDSSDSSKLRQSSTQFGTSTTTFLRNDGTFAAPPSGNTWTLIKSGQSTVNSGASGTAVTNISLGSNTIDDTTVVAFEINTAGNTLYTSQILIAKIEDSSSTYAGLLYNALANSNQIRVGSLRVFRTFSGGPTSTSLSFSYVNYFSNGSTSETADTVYIGNIWKLGVTGA